jgi:hypothetical protein
MAQFTILSLFLISIFPLEHNDRVTFISESALANHKRADSYGPRLGESAWF